jgi:hypothetical protein
MILHLERLPINFEVQKRWRSVHMSKHEVIVR